MTDPIKAHIALTQRQAASNAKILPDEPLIEKRGPGRPRKHPLPDDPYEPNPFEGIPPINLIGIAASIGMIAPPEPILNLSSEQSIIE